MIHSLLPVFLVVELGAGTISLGWIEGLAEATASISKVFSGVLSDWIGRRKPLVLAGYGLAALSKPLFPVATSAWWVLVARFVDRLGKGMRGSPRDALVADLTPSDIRGAAYGLRQALDTAGALVGPLAAIVLMAVLSKNIRAVFWVAAVPAICAVVVLALFVREPAESQPAPKKRTRFAWGELGRFGAPFWFVVAVGALLSIARFSEAFFVLRANDAGLPVRWTPLAFAVMNVAYVATAYPFGRLSDRIDRVWLLAGGVAVLGLSEVILALGGGLIVIFVGIAIWGVHMGMTHGLLAAMVADAAPSAARGSAFGVFHFVSGISMLAGSVLAGAMWQWHGPAATFSIGAAFSAATLLTVVWAARSASPKE
jgi:MFS family permease